MVSRRGVPLAHRGKLYVVVKYHVLFCFKFGTVPRTVSPEQSNNTKAKTYHREADHADANTVPGSSISASSETLSKNDRLHPCYLFRL